MKRSWLLIIAVAAATSPLRADTKSACSTVFEKAQAQRLEGKTREAYEAARQCALPSCPSVVRPLCAKWVTELEGELASVTISVHDEQGQPVTSSSATLDGAKSETGTAIWVEKGAHKLVVEHGGQRVERSFDAAAGERGRAIVVVLAAPKPAATSPARPPVESAPAPTAVGEAPRTGAFVATGLSVLGLGAFIYFGSSGKSDQHKLETSCSPNCAKDDVDPIRRKFLFADVGLATAVIAGSVATYLFLQPSEHTTIGVGPGRADVRFSF